jgi:hypothetical protein
MSIKIDALVSALAAIRNNASLTVSQRTAAAELAIARGVAYNLPVPADGNIIPTGYFNNELAPIVKEALSTVNEAASYDVQRVYALTYELWSARFNMVHMPNSIESDVLTRAMISVGKQMNPAFESLVVGEEDPANGEIMRGITRVGHCFTGNLVVAAREDGVV